MVKHEYITRLTVVDRDKGRLLELWDLKDVELSYQDSDGKNMRTLKVFISQSNPNDVSRMSDGEIYELQGELQSKSKSLHIGTLNDDISKLRELQSNHNAHEPTLEGKSKATSIVNGSQVREPDKISNPTTTRGEEFVERRDSVGNDTLKCKRCEHDVACKKTTKACHYFQGLDMRS